MQLPPASGWGQTAPSRSCPAVLRRVQTGSTAACLRRRLWCSGSATGSHLYPGAVHATPPDQTASQRDMPPRGRYAGCRLHPCRCAPVPDHGHIAAGQKPAASTGSASGPARAGTAPVRADRDDRHDCALPAGYTCLLMMFHPIGTGTCGPIRDPCPRVACCLHLWHLAGGGGCSPSQVHCSGNRIGHHCGLSTMFWSITQAVGPDEPPVCVPASRTCVRLPRGLHTRLSDCYGHGGHAMGYDRSPRPAWSHSPAPVSASRRQVPNSAFGPGSEVQA